MACMITRKRPQTASCIALEGYGLLTVACARTTLGAIALLVLMRVLRRPLPAFTPDMGGYLIAIGLLNTAVPFALLSWGQQFVPSAFAGISMAALPLSVLPLAHVFTDETMNMRNSLGVILGFVGAAVLVGPGVLRIGTGMEPLGQLEVLQASSIKATIFSLEFFACSSSLHLPFCASKLIAYQALPKGSIG